MRALERGVRGNDCGCRGWVILGWVDECILGGRWDGAIGRLERVEAA